MLLSMTGHGEARRQSDGIVATVEVRTINSRYFKIHMRSTEGASSFEPQIDAIVRGAVRRGTVQVGLRIDREASADDFRVNETVLAGYRRQLERLCDQLHVSESIRLGELMTLPGVVDEGGAEALDTDTFWPIIEQALTEALDHLAKMRAEEGRAMAESLAENCKLIAGELDQIAERAPRVVEAYRERLTERLNKLLAEYDVSVQPSDVIREVGLFAERCDIAEEVVRLRSHLDQFAQIMESTESNGRKLEFLTQEMFRETNTIGSKANDAEIARHVIEIKAEIERMREMIQNVE